MLTIPVPLRKIYFLTNLKNGKNVTFSGLNANGLEIKPRVEQDMTFLIPTIISILTSKKLIFKGKIMGFRF